MDTALEHHSKHRGTHTFLAICVFPVQAVLFPRGSAGSCGAAATQPPQTFLAGLLSSHSPPSLLSELPVLSTLSAVSSTYRLLPSANSLTVHSAPVSRSLIKIFNRTGQECESMLCVPNDFIVL